MLRSPFAALAVIPLLSAGNAPSAPRFKEAACVQISAPAGTPSPRLVITVKGQGVRVYKSNCALPVAGAFMTSDTVTAPTKLLVMSIGAGQAELVSLDPAVKYTVSIEAMAGGPTESKTVTASRVVIDHSDMQHPFSIREISAANP